MEQLMVIQKTVFLVCASALIYPSLHAQTIQPSQAGLNSVISATRFIDSPKYTPGSAIQIKILINNPCGQTHDVWIKEDVPSGCTVKSTNPAAVIGQKALTWRFSIHPGITTINYSLNIPYFFNEALQFHGHVNYVIIEGVAKVQCDFGHFSDMADWGTSDFLPQIGKFKVKGKVLTRKLDNSYVYDLFGNGDHIYATQDEGLYIYTTRAGSWCFSGKFIWVNPGTSKLKPQLGIMIRESGRSSVSKHYSILLSPYRRTDIINDCLCVIKWREFTKGNTEQLPIPEAEILGNVNNMDPAWILSQDFYFRVTRVSHLNLFISEWSQDGINWFFANSQIIKMNEPLSYGLVISNQNDSSQLSHGRVSGISFQPASPFAIRSLGADFYQPNDMINVSLELINPTTQTVHVNLEEKIPPGWLIGQTSNDGIHQDGRISWSIAASPGEKQLQYTVLASEGFAEFSGFASRHKIIGDNRLVEMRSLYNKESFKNWIFWHTTDGLSNTSLNRIIVNSTNTIFVEDMNHAGWNRLDGFHVSHIPSPNGNEIIRESPSGQIWSVSCADSDENRIFSGFLEYHKSNWILHATDKFLDLNYISFDLCEPNKIYVLFNDRLVEWNVSTQIMTTLLSTVETCLTSFTKFILFGKNNIWICGEEGLVHIDISDGQIHNHPIDPRLKIYNIHHIHAVRNHGLFISANSRVRGTCQIIQFDGQEWSLLRESHGDIHGFLDNNQDLWYHDVTNRSLYKLNSKNIQDSGHHSVISSIVNDLTVDEDGNIWVSLINGLAKHHINYFKIPFLLSGNQKSIYSILEFPTNTLWFITPELLLCYKNNEWNNYPIPQTLKLNRDQRPYLEIYDDRCIIIHGFVIDLMSDQYECSLLFDATHKRFIVNKKETSDVSLSSQNPAASYGKNFADYDNLIFQSNAPITPENILCASILSNNSIWIGAKNEIWMYQNDQWNLFRSGLGQVYQIMEDRNGAIWIASDTGLYRYQDDVLQKYDVNDGLPSTTIFTIFQDYSGKIWIGASEGISFFQSDVDLEPPETFLTESTKSHYHTIPPAGTARISYGGIDRWKSTPSERLLFSHRVDGGKWSEFSSETDFISKHLSIGPHQFDVRAMDLNWNIDQTPATFSFTIMAPWYKEPLFLVIISAALFIIVVFISIHISNYFNLSHLVAARTECLLNDQKKLKELTSELSLTEERERRRLASDLHDSICQTLSLSIMELTTLFKNESKDEIHRKTIHITNQLNKTLQATQHLTFELCPPELYQLGLETAIEEMCRLLRKQYGIHFLFEDDGNPKPVSEDLRYFLFRATRELLVNINKHANAGRAKVTIARLNDFIQINVWDNGQGLSSDNHNRLFPSKHGFGLFSIQERLHQIGGSLTFESSSGRGTSVTIRAPLSTNGDKKL